MDLKIMPGAEPTLMLGGSVGVLCLHGLSASPQEVFWLAKYLNQKGFTTFSSRLYGHGVHRDLMRRVRWQDWFLSALDGYHLLAERCEKVFVSGLSMGGLLSLRLAAQEQVAGIVPLAAAYRTYSKIQYSHYLRPFVPVAKEYPRQGDMLNERIKAVQAARGERVTGRVSYYQQTMAGVAELHKLQMEITRILPLITCPVLLINSPKDSAVPMDAMHALKAGLTNAASVETLVLKDSDHILTNDVEHEQVFEAVETFIKKLI